MLNNSIFLRPSLLGTWTMKVGWLAIVMLSSPESGRNKNANLSMSWTAMDFCGYLHTPFQFTRKKGWCHGCQGINLLPFFPIDIPKTVGFCWTCNLLLLQKMRMHAWKFLGVYGMKRLSKLYGLFHKPFKKGSRFYNQTWISWFMSAFSLELPFCLKQDHLLFFKTAGQEFSYRETAETTISAAKPNLLLFFLLLGWPLFFGVAETTSGCFNWMI